MRALAVAIVLSAAALLAGCDPVTLRGSVAGSCDVFERPPYAVRGATAYDQRVADGFVESGVAACGWKRPAPRPAALDLPAARKAAPPAKKKRLLQRVKEKILPAAQAAPAPAPPPEPPPPAPEETKFQDRFPASPRDPTALEQLLGGKQ